MRNKRIKIEQALVFLCSVVFLVIFINRLRFGIETSDEAFYCAMGYRFIKGNIPFGDMWEAMATNGFIMAPFLLIRSFFVSNGEGIQLFLRFCFLFLNGVAAIGVYKYSNIELKKEYSSLLALLFWFNAPFQIYTFSYNNMANTFITLALCMMLLGIYHKKWFYFYLMGISIALAVLAYPTMIYFGVILSIIILLAQRSRQIYYDCLYYVLGGITLAVPVVLYISHNVGFNNMVANLSYILSSDSAHSLSASHIISSIFDAFIYLKFPFNQNGKWFCAYWIVLVILATFKRTKPISKYLVALYPIVCLHFSLSDGVKTVMEYTFFMAMIAPVSILISDYRVKMLKKCIFEWGLALLPYFVLSFSTGGGHRQAIAGLIFAVIISMKLLIEAMEGKVEVKFEKFVIYFMLLTAIGSEIFAFYGGTYRDETYSQLTAKVENGVYRGIYTTPERKQHIEDLGDVMAQLEDKDETVMILYHSCYAYLMVDMVPKIPSTWGCYDYQAYGFENQDMFLKYLENEDNIPENIFIIDIPEQYDYAAQKADRYRSFYPKLNYFIEEHYNLVGTFEQGESGTVTKYEINHETY